MEELYTRLVTILTTEFDIAEDRISREASFESLDLDSLDLVELLLVVDEQLGVRIDDDEVEALVTVGAAVDAIAAKSGVSA